MVNWEYSESVESQEIVNIKDKYQNFINGKFQQPNSKKYIKSKRDKQYRHNDTESYYIFSIFANINLIKSTI